MKPEIADQIRALAANGHAQREIAELTGASKSAVARVLAQREASGATPASSRASASPSPLSTRLGDVSSLLASVGCTTEAATVLEAARRLSALEATEPDDIDPEPEGDAEPGDLLGMLQRAARQIERDCALHRRIGNAGALERSRRTLAQIAPVLARVEKQARDEAKTDIVRVSVAEVAEVEERVRGMVNAIIERGGKPLCARCSAQLSAAWGEGAK